MTVKKALLDEALNDPNMVTELEADRVRVYRDRTEALLRGADPGPPPKLKKVAKPPTRGPTHLVIPDAHSDPAVPNQRFDWLGAAIVDIQPEVVIDIGDFGSFSSMGKFDRPGSLQSEGRRYSEDIDAYIDAQSRIRYAIEKCPDYKPKLIRVLGNHEHRIVRAVEDNPQQFQGNLGLRDLMSAEFGWQQHDYGQPVDIDGIRYVHHFMRGGRPFGCTEYGCLQLAKSEGTSSVFGHTHKKAYAEWADSMGFRRFSINVGCYFTHWERYAGTDNSRWWAGLVVIRDIRDGFGDVEFMSMDTVQRRYA